MHSVHVGNDIGSELGKVWLKMNLVHVGGEIGELRRGEEGYVLQEEKGEGVLEALFRHVRPTKVRIDGFHKIIGA